MPSTDKARGDSRERIEAAALKLFVLEPFPSVFFHGLTFFGFEPLALSLHRLCLELKFMMMTLNLPIPELLLLLLFKFEPFRLFSCFFLAGQLFFGK